MRQLLAEGALVVSCARREAGLAEARDRLAREGAAVARLVSQACDVRDEASIAALADLVRSRFGRADILVNNAGQARLSSFASTLDADWAAERDLQLFSVMPYPCFPDANLHLDRLPNGGFQGL